MVAAILLAEYSEIARLACDASCDGDGDVGSILVAADVRNLCAIASGEIDVVFNRGCACAFGRALLSIIAIRTLRDASVVCTACRDGARVFSANGGAFILAVGSALGVTASFVAEGSVITGLACAAVCKCTVLLTRPSDIVASRAMGVFSMESGEL